VSPRNETEELLAGIWREVLKVDRVGVTDNFFEIGGDSLRAMHLVTRIQSDLNAEVSLRDLFEYPTVSEIAERFTGSGGTGYESIERAEEKEYYHTSSAQRRMYILNQISGETKSYNMPGMFDVSGNLDRGRLEEAARGLIERHESLRTSFHVIDGEVMQKIHGGVAFNVEYCESSEEGVGDLFLEFIRPFDLSGAPLLRMMVVRTGEDSHVLCFDMHHIVSDGVSLGVLIRDFIGLYEGEELTPVRLRYKDFSEWQHRIFATEAFRKQEGYWLDRFSGDLPVLNLPLDHPRPSVQSFEGDRIGHSIAGELYEGLQRLVKETGSTLYMVLLSAFNVFLSRYSGQNDIVVGSPMAGRSHSDLQNIIGIFVNTMVLRSNPEGEKSFLEFLGEVKRSTLEALENQEYPFEELVERLSVSRDMSRNPLFDVMFTLENFGNPAFRLGGMSVVQRRFEYQIAKFDLTLTARQGAEAVEVEFEYNTSLFERSTAERMLDHYVEILKGVVSDASMRLDEIAILTEADRAVVARANTGQTEYPREECIHEWFERVAGLSGDSVAVLLGDESLRYGELNDRANQLAHHLRKRGVGADVPVGICLERSIEMIVAILGILKAGGAYVPLDPTNPGERLAYILNDVQTKILLTHSGLLNTFPDYEGERICLDSDWPEIGAGRRDNPVSEAGPDNLAYIIYTSGSTGQPKGSLMTHRNVTRLFDGTEGWYHFDDSDVWTMFHSYAFDVSVYEIWGALLYGGRLVVVPYWISRSPEEFYRLLIDQKVTVLSQTPSAFYPLIEVDGKHGGGVALSLRYVIFAGEALNFRNLAPWFERHGEDAPRLVNMYGITETTVHVTYYPVSRDDVYRNGSVIGMAIPDLQLHILDGRLHRVPVGVPGELCVSGAGLGRGYLNRPDLTAEKFVENPYLPGERMYRSGDLARWLPDGNIEYLGRIDHQVKIRGFRIELGEIESRLGEHPGIREVSIVVHEGVGGEKQLAACYVPDDGKPAVSELRSFLKERLPDYMVPAHFIELEEMPLTSNGKVDRRALLGLQPDRSGIGEYVSPRNETEELLAGIWREVLKVDRVGVTDNFFEIGGDSLRVITLVQKVRDEVERSLSLAEIYQHPTIEEIALVLEEKNEESQLDYGKLRFELENVLNDHEDVMKALVAVRLIEESGSEYMFVDAYIVLKQNGCDLTEKALYGYLQNRVPVKYLPHRIHRVRHLPSMDQSVVKMELSSDDKLPSIADRLNARNTVKLIRREVKRDLLGCHQLKSYKPAAAQYLFLKHIGTVLDSKNQIYMRIDGLDKDEIELILNQFMSRHAILRTIAGTDENGDVVFREIKVNGELPIPFVDFSDLDLDRLQTTVHYIGQELLRYPFQLSSWPLFRWVLVKEGIKSYRLIWIFSHLISDGSNLDILFRRFRRICELYFRGEKNDIPVERKTYYEYALEMRNQVERLEFSRYSGYLTKYSEILQHSKTVLKNKRDKSGKFNLQMLRIKQSEVRQIQEVVSDQGMHNILLAVFAKACAAWSGIERIPIGEIRHGRSYGVKSYFDVAGDLTDYAFMLPKASSEDSLAEVINSIQESLNLMDPHENNQWCIVERWIKEEGDFDKDIVSAPFVFNYQEAIKGGQKNNSPVMLLRLQSKIRSLPVEHIYRNLIMMQVVQNADDLVVYMISNGYKKSESKILFDMFSAELGKIREGI
jgi:amino acid adenylation domain-containing protein